MPGILEQLGILSPINADQTMTPEEIAQLQAYGTALTGAQGNRNKLLKPGPGEYGATHWSQGVADLLNAIAGRRAIDTANASQRGQRLARPSTIGPAQVNAPPVSATTRGSIPTAGTRPNPWITNTQPSVDTLTEEDRRIPNLAPGGGAEEVASEQPMMRLGGSLSSAGEQAPDRSSFDPGDTESMQQLDAQNQIQGQPQPAINTEQTPPITPVADRPQTTQQVNQQNRTIAGLPVYDPSALPESFRPTYPTPPPFRYGLTPQQEINLSNQRPEDRERMEKAFEQQWTPRETKILGGTRWIVPATGETGFIPEPKYDKLETPSGTIDTITLYDQHGRRITYALEPGITPQPVNAPGQQQTIQPQIEPNAPQPNAPQPNAPQPNAPQPNMPEQLGQQFGEGVGGQTFLDNPIFRRSRDIQIEQANRQKTATDLADVANQPIRAAVEAGNTARQTLSIVDMLQSIMNTPQAERVMTGRFSQQWLDFQTTVNGVIRAAGGRPFFSEDGIWTAESMHKLNTYLGSAAARQLTNRPTQFDFQAFLRANPGLSADIAASRVLAQILRQFAERDVAIANAAGQFAERAGQTGRIANWTTEMQRIYDQHMLSIGETILNAHIRSGLRIPVGFRYNGLEYVGGPPTGPDSRNSWRPINQGNR